MEDCADGNTVALCLDGKVSIIQGAAPPLTNA